MAKICAYPKCKKPTSLSNKIGKRIVRRKHCNFHHRNRTISGFLARSYSNMLGRIRGYGTNRPDLYYGKSIMPRDTFLIWSENHPAFLKLYKRWTSEDFSRRLRPVVNRLKSSGGYTLDNVEWITLSQNCGLASSERSRKAKREIYNLLGVNNVQ